MNKPPLPMPPTVHQCRSARIAVADIFAALPLDVSRNFAKRAASLADFFTACEQHSAYVFAGPAKPATKTPTTDG